MNLLGKLAFRLPKISFINQMLFPFSSLHTSSTLYNSIPKSSPSQLNDDEPPKSDTIVPTSLSSAFKNMYDDSAILSSQAISRLTRNGFITRDEIEVKGPVILVNGDIFMWNVPQGQGFGQGINRKGGVFDNWIVDFLKLFEVITPKPDLLVFGTGKSFVPIPSNIKQYINDLGMQTEVIDTKNAVATFNVLAEEGRNVAAALLPLTPTCSRTGKAF
ncbi:14360_t:CDS:2 [Funneliformis caledonium]|uniref:14360_t:CDS:1 n=1 Tax=Funneliformis caledonium TaxID=1117310 RepID=A0A9N9DZZ9_9GLOM|nr:14360_t:CDS:2 [Funneliformis caledonium]